MGDIDYRSHSCAPVCAEHPFSSGYDWSEAIRAVTPADDTDDGYPCCGGYAEHRYRCPNRVWPATATTEIRRTAIRGDCIGPAHAQIEDLVHGLDYQQRKRLTGILAGIWDDGHGWGAEHG
jgi:hypothetical protein